MSGLMTTTFTKSVIQPLLEGQSLDREAARMALEEVLHGDLDQLVIAAFLTAITAKGETVAEMTGFVDAMMASAAVSTPPRGCVDIVGTGGDQLHSVNISTMAAIAVAGAGVRVAKHGNRSATSSVGSADVLEGLGVNIAVTGDVVERCIDESGFGFYFAPMFHSSLAALAPIRRTLGFRTVFNVLGPLANPAQVAQTVVGVAQLPLLRAMAEVLAARGVHRATLVRGDDGLDELSLGTTSTLITVDSEQIDEWSIDAGAVLERRHDVASLVGGGVDQNVEVFRKFLEGTPGPVADVVCANAALALMNAGQAESLEEGFRMAAESVSSGAALRVLQRVIEVSNA